MNGESKDLPDSSLVFIKHVKFPLLPQNKLFLINFDNLISKRLQRMFIKFKFVVFSFCFPLTVISTTDLLFSNGFLSFKRYSVKMCVRIYLDLHTSSARVKLTIQLIRFADFHITHWRTIYILSPAFVAAAVATTIEQYCSFSLSHNFLSHNF